MSSRLRRTIPTIVAGSLGIGATFASAAEPTQQELMQQIQQLQGKVAALEQKQTTATAADVDATVAKVLNDANKRSQLLPSDGSFIAGYDNNEQRFVLKNADNSFSFSPQLHWQFRNITDFRQDVKNGGGDDIQNGFELRRVKLELGGTMFTPDMTYFIQFNANRSGGGVALEDAWVRYMFAPDWGFRAGQFKDPFSHEELTSDKRILTVDRSMMNTILHPGGNNTRVQGATLIYGGYAKDNPLNVEGGLTDGNGSVNTNFQDDSNGENWGAAARAEFKVWGDWKDYADQSARNNKQGLLVLGAGADVTDFPNDMEYTGMVDVQWETSGGLGIYASAMGEYEGSRNDGPTLFNYGGLIQAGYLINGNWEVFGRADITVDDFDTNGSNAFPEFTVGFNYFMGPNGSWGHRCKFTVEADWLPNGAPFNLNGIGYQGNPGNNEVAIKAQFQFYL